MGSKRSYGRGERQQKTNPAVDHWRGVTGSQAPDGGNVRSFLAPNILLGALLLSQLTACADARLRVRDQGTGVAVVQARVYELRPGGDVLLDEADADGALALRLPADEQAIIAVRAEGFVQWSKSVAWLRSQPSPLLIQLEPAWMADFRRTGTKPSEIVVPPPCPCLHLKSR
jgi:hypothetical protein